jgi:uncharacterized protein (TIGR03435 family)
MKNTNSAVTAGVAVLAALTVAMGAHGQTDQIQEFWFDPSNLKHAPADLAVVRTTQFPDSYDKIAEREKRGSLTRASGRNVTLRDLMAEAYGTGPGQVVLPPDAASEHFDFIVTTSGDARQRLQSAIREATGYTAHMEARNTDVLKLEVQDANLSGMTISPADEDEDVQYKDGILYFKHKSPGYLVRGLEDGLGKPVIDETGLTNSYDFSVPWNAKTTQAMQAGSWHLENVQKVLNGWGLDLEPATETMNMVVVEKAQ